MTKSTTVRKEWKLKSADCKDSNEVDDEKKSLFLWEFSRKVLWMGFFFSLPWLDSSASVLFFVWIWTKDEQRKLRWSRQISCWRGEGIEIDAIANRELRGMKVEAEMKGGKGFHKLGKPLGRLDSETRPSSNCLPTKEAKARILWHASLRAKKII